MKVPKRITVSVVAGSLASAAAAQIATQPADVSRQTVTAPQNFGSWGVDLTARNMTVKPGDGFFEHVNGAWAARTVIAQDLPVAGVGVDLQTRTQAQLRNVIEDNVNKPASPSAAMVSALYKSFINEERVEQLDAKPLASDLKEINQISTKSEMARRMGHSHHGFGASLFKLSVTLDAKNPNAYAVEANIGGMGLPDRDFYLSERFAPQKLAYQNYVARTLGLIGWPDAQKAAEEIVAFESSLAQVSWTRAERRDPVKTYNPETLASLQALTPEFDWKAYLAGLDIGPVDRVIVTQKSAFPAASRIYNGSTLATLKSWQAFHAVHQAAPYLSKRFVDNRFEITKRLSGQQQASPRWNRGVSLVNSTLGHALGQEYVRRHFPATSKASMETLVTHLQTAMRNRIEKATWLGQTSKAEALKKLAAQRVMVGYPDRARSYAGMKLNAGDLYGNLKRATSFSTRYDFARLGRPVDGKDWWFLTPQTVDAAFNQLRNEMVFPAAMLQAPFFNPEADAAVNYGAAGAIIGHEITHGFDDKGRQFDSSGKLRDWWQADDAARFSEKADKLASQYDSFEALPGAKVNGKLTLGENIGDQGGLLIALDAYRASLKGRAAPVINGYTGEQRLFLSWAQAWRSKVRPEMLRAQLAADPHSPPRFRVDGVVRNIDAWYTAFDIKPGDALYLKPDDRTLVW